MGSKTRSDLIEVKAKIALAKRGHSLLKKKQDVLINKFFNLVKEYKQFKKTIQEKTKNTYNALSLDIAYTGLFASRSVSYAAKPAFDISYKTQNIMGVKIPVMSTTRKARGIDAFENSPQLDQTSNLFYDLFEELVKLSSLEQTIYALADEIKKVKRRVNALEHIQIPKLTQEQKDIRFALEEIERESFMRLKMIKRKMDAKN